MQTFALSLNLMPWMPMKLEHGPDARHRTSIAQQKTNYCLTVHVGLLQYSNEEEHSTKHTL